jgi:hypothetical protein
MQHAIRNNPASQLRVTLRNTNPHPHARLCQKNLASFGWRYQKRGFAALRLGNLRRKTPKTRFQLGNLRLALSKTAVCTPRTWQPSIGAIKNRIPLATNLATFGWRYQKPALSHLRNHLPAQLFVKSPCHPRFVHQNAAPAELSLPILRESLASPQIFPTMPCSQPKKVKTHCDSHRP